MESLTVLRSILQASAARLDLDLLVADQMLRLDSEGLMGLSARRSYLQLVLNHDLVQLRSAAVRLESAILQELSRLDESLR